MARIAESEIERLKLEISVERLAVAKGIALARHGKDLMGRCPFHDDRTPSLVITPEKNLWHCLGACQTGGSVIDWVMKAEGLSFRHAVELLRADLPSLAAFSATKMGRQTTPVAKKTTTPKMATVLEPSESDDVLMKRVVAFYHSTLKASPEALEYLSRRGLQSAEMLERFQIGFANRTLSYRLPSKNRQTGAELRGQLEKLGLYRESGHEHFNGSIVIPVMDEAGRVTEMYGRKITARLRPGTPNHLYLAGPHRGVWNVEALAASKTIILCEALIDALTFWCAGFRNVTSSYGVEGFTDDHVAAFKKHGTEKVLIAYDRDDAGDQAAEKLSTKLMEMGIECSRVRFPRGMDANEYAQKVTPAAQSLAVVLRQAEWMGKGKRAAPAEMLAAENESAATGATTMEIESDGKILVVSKDGEVLEERDAEGPGFATKEASPELEDRERIPSLVAEQPLATKADAASADEVSFRFGDRKWRVRGLGKNASSAVLKVNVLVARDNGGFHVDALELYSARQRAAYVTLAAAELGVEERVVKKELGELILKLEELQEKRAAEGSKSETKAPKLTEEERAAALALLRDPKLLERIVEDFDRCGVVGERTNKLVGYLAATSRKLDEPLAIVIQSSSAAGKSSLMDAVLNLMPEEERSQYSAMTGQSLFYLGETDIRHKILAIVEEEGAERASYALKLLQSEGELTIASTGKDPVTGRLVTQEYRVEGPVMIFLTTTAIEVDEELLNRCIVLSVDEGREQTRAIHARQRAAQTLAGVLGRRDKDAVVKLHRNAQRLLRPVLVVNPFARELSFLDTATRTRRDHKKYLELIRVIALVHQYQRPMKSVEHRGQRIEYIEATREDIATANRLCHEVLGRSLDELPPQTRRLLGLVEAMVVEGCERIGVDREDFRFSRREVREATSWGNTQIRVHLDRLIEMEYVIAHRGKQGQSYTYELAYDGRGKDGAPFLHGLLDVDANGKGVTTIPTSRGSSLHFAGGLRGKNGPVAVGVRGGETCTEPLESSSNANREAPSVSNARPGGARAKASYSNVAAVRVAVGGG